MNLCVDVFVCRGTLDLGCFINEVCWSPLVLSWRRSPTQTLGTASATGGLQSYRKRGSVRCSTWGQNPDIAKARNTEDTFLGDSFFPKVCLEIAVFGLHVNAGEYLPALCRMSSLGILSLGVGSSLSASNNSGTPFRMDSR